jgi:hypothetical protein
MADHTTKPDRMEKMKSIIPMKKALAITVYLTGL